MTTVPRDRTSLAALTLVAAAGAAWAGLAAWEPPMGLVGFLLGWALMMTAMMLPSIVPLALLYRGSRELLAVGYLAVWTATGIVPYVAMEQGFEPAVPFVLALAGLYELSPLKAACLRRCQDPATFLMQHYRSGPLRLGVEHGLWCIGCCIGLMVVLVLAASMGLGWAAVIAGIVTAQKVLRLGERVAWATGVGLLAAAVVTAIG
jgi:predicted metal-binding membrane protein